MVLLYDITYGPLIWYRLWISCIVETITFLYGGIQSLRHLKNRKQWEPDVGLRAKPNHFLLHLRQHCITLISGRNHFVSPTCSLNLLRLSNKKRPWSFFSLSHWEFVLRDCTLYPLSLTMPLPNPSFVSFNSVQTVGDARGRLCPWF